MYVVSRKRKIGVQAGCSLDSLKTKSTQCGPMTGSYKRMEKTVNLTYDQLRDNYLWDKDRTLLWVKDELGLICQSQVCDICSEEMKLTACNDRHDGVKWECRRVKDEKRHRSEKSVRKGSWFEKANLTLEEAMKFTYWWTKGLTQKQIKEQLGLGSNTAVDWDMFCREMCEVTLRTRSEAIGGPGKCVQIDESKIGKRKYHRGYRVDGQWVFGGIEEFHCDCRR